MRLVRKDIKERDGSGTATLIPQEPEDMWHLYNLIRAGDTLRAPAIRKVTKEAASTSSVISSTVRTNLTVRVVRTDFDSAAGQLHVSGRVCEENPHVSIGMHHTLDLELNRQFTLEKGGEDGWDSVALEMLREATDIKKKAEVYAVVLQEGLANICVVTDYQTLVRQTVETSIPRKRMGHGADSHDRGLDKFYETVMTTLLRTMDVPTLLAEGKSPPLLLAGPGFVAQGLQKHILAYATRVGDKGLLTYARNSILVAHASSGHLHALAEVLKSPPVLAKLSDTKYARETQLMEKFMELLREDDGRAWYGPKEVERAVEKGAVGRGGGVLLISNKLFRSQDVQTRKRWVSLVDKVRQEEGGEVRVLSSAHESGKRLEGLGDIGAILTFPLPDLDEDEDVAENGGLEQANGQDHDRIGDPVDDIEI
jgi:protein pelota